MSEYKKRPDFFKEAVSIETQRIFDTCSERDCICDLPVCLDQGCCLTECMNIVKTRCADVSSVCIAVDPVPFKDGYFSVDITYTFSLAMDAYENTCTDECCTLSGTAVWNKRVILYGANGDIKTFSSDDPISSEEKDTCCCRIINKPKVTVNVVTPIALETKIDCKKIKTSCSCDPVHVKGIYVTLGLFSVIQLTRPVSLLIPTYDYCIPGKECCSPAESPCEIFSKLDFPTEQFFPRSVIEKICGGTSNSCHDHDHDHDHDYDHDDCGCKDSSSDCCFDDEIDCKD